MTYTARYSISTFSMAFKDTYSFLPSQWLIQFAALFLPSRWRLKSLTLFLPSQCFTYTVRYLFLPSQWLLLATFFTVSDVNYFISYVSMVFQVG